MPSITNGNHYIAVQPGSGTTGAVAPTGTGGGIEDGTVVWAWVMVAPATSTQRGAATMLGMMHNVNSQIAAAVPGVPIIMMTCTPDAASSNLWVDAAGQTPATGWGAVGSRRSLINGFVRAKHYLLWISQYFDPSAVLEDGYPVESSTFISNGVAKYATGDGTHFSSNGYALGAATLTKDKFI